MPDWRKVVKTYGIPALMYVLGAFSSSFFGKLGELAAEYTPAKSVIIDACAPLKEARMILKAKTSEGEKILSDSQIEFINETSVYIRNDTEIAIKNAFITIYPVSQQKDLLKILYTRMYASSMRGSKEYSVERSGSAYQVSVPLLNAGDFILVETKFNVPISYIVEIFADGTSQKSAFEPGCDGGSYGEFILPTAFFEYYGPACKQTPMDAPVDCSTDMSVPIEITEEMRGKDLTQELQIIK